MENQKFRVRESHTSEYQEPLILDEGTPIIVGEKYEGKEGWNDWYFCESLDQKGGWVPSHIIEDITSKHSRATQSYTSKELNVTTGEIVFGGKILNGWIWCTKIDGLESGWVPLFCLNEDK